MKISTRKKTDPRIYQDLQKEETKVARNQFAKELVRNASRMLNEGKNSQSDIVNYIIKETLTLNPEIKRELNKAFSKCFIDKYPDIDSQYFHGLIDPDEYNRLMNEYNYRLNNANKDELTDNEKRHVEILKDLHETAENILSYIKETGKHKPLGIDRWVTLTPAKLNHLADIYIGKDESENLVFRALKLLTSEFGMPFNINPQVLYSLTGLDKRTVQRAIKRLTESHQDFIVLFQDTTCQYRVTSLPKGKRMGRQIQVSIPMQGEPNTDKWAVNQEQKHWQMLHELNTGRPPRYHNDPRAPHLYLRDGNIKAKLGTFSLIELFNRYTDFKSDTKFSYEWRAQNIPSQRMKAYPYTVTDDFWENESNKQAINFLYEVQFTMQDKGIPVNIEKIERFIQRFEGYLAGTRKLPRELLDKYGERELKPEKKQAKIDEKITNRLRILRKIKKHYEPETERIYPTIIPRATVSERAGTRWPNIQNIPKDIRHIFQNSEETLLILDISGQENYLITEMRNFESMREINTYSDLATCIHERTGIDRKQVKTIAHALTKGKGIRTYNREGNGEIARRVAHEIRKAEPRWDEHREARIDYNKRTHGRTEKTKLGQSGIIVDRRRADCQAVAIADQMQGAEQKRLWLCKLKSMLPVGCEIGMDMHDAVGITIRREANVDIQTATKKAEEALNAANDDLGFKGKAKLTAKEYEDTSDKRSSGKESRSYRYNQPMRIKRRQEAGISQTRRKEPDTLNGNSRQPRANARQTPVIWVHYFSGQTNSPDVLPGYSPRSLFPP